MNTFVVVLLAVLSLGFIIYPLFKQKWSAEASYEDERFRELHSRRDTTYSLLKELEFDFQSGILTEEDYRDLEARYKRRAISILKDADVLEKGAGVGGAIEERVQRLRRRSSNDLDKDLNKEVEEEVLKLRRSKGNNPEEEVEEEVLKLRQSKGRFCPQCGTKSEEDDLFCVSCGTRLK